MWNTTNKKEKTLYEIVCKEALPFDLKNGTPNNKYEIDDLLLENEDIVTFVSLNDNLDDAIKLWEEKYKNYGETHIKDGKMFGRWAELWETRCDEFGDFIEVMYVHRTSIGESVHMK